MIVPVLLDQENLRKDLLATGFEHDREGAVDLRKETSYFLNGSTFKTLEKDFLAQFEEKLTEYQRYLITGPEGKEVLIWYSPKWGGIKLCFVSEIKPL